MIVVSYSVNGSEDVKQFPSTPKGNRESIKFLNELRGGRLADPYYIILELKNKIWHLNKELKELSMKAAKARMKIEIKILELSEELETEYLIYGKDLPEPKQLKVSITHK